MSRTLTAAPLLDIPAEDRTAIACGDWVPSPELCEKALVRIRAFLRNNVTLGEIDQIVTKNPKYKVQFIGVYRNKHYLLLCNFFPSNEFFPDWKQKQVFVSDGEFYFWRIEYDPTTNRCTSFQANGPA
jgi:hypothetical protein